MEKNNPILLIVIGWLENPANYTDNFMRENMTNASEYHQDIYAAAFNASVTKVIKHTEYWVRVCLSKSGETRQDYINKLKG
jgi:hypothetical protein